MKAWKDENGAIYMQTNGRKIKIAEPYLKKKERPTKKTKTSST